MAVSVASSRLPSMGRFFCPPPAPLLHLGGDAVAGRGSGGGCGVKEQDRVVADMYWPPHTKRRMSLARRNRRSQGRRWHGRRLDLDRRPDGDGVVEVVTMSACGHIPRRRRAANGPDLRKKEKKVGEFCEEEEQDKQYDQLQDGLLNYAQNLRDK